MELIALIALGLAVGFGGAVWLMVAFFYWRRQQPWGAFWYFNIALADLVAAFIIGYRLTGHSLNLARGVSTLLLLPIIVLPPALQLAALVKAKRLTSHDE
jgi:hypothetical protein